MVLMRRISSSKALSFQNGSLLCLLRRTSSVASSNPESVAAPNSSLTESNSSSAPRKGLGLQLFNSLTQRVEPLQLFSGDDVASTTRKGLAWYTCGPTVYAPAHLGHARTYVWMDILRRVVEHEYRRLETTEGGREFIPPPLFVLNITDVDDKILAAASDRQEPALELARGFEAEFFSQWDELNCLRPHVVTRVTEHVQSAIVPYIQRIHDNGVSYFIEGDGLYFDVRAFEHVGQVLRLRYGKLAPSSQATDLFDNHPQSLDASSDSKDVTRKKDPRDFCLWKLRKDGETMYWSSPWGDGRPGWHIECSAMIQSVQDMFHDQYKFLVHAGGIDLQFPHHTNEIAQAEAYALQHQDREEDKTKQREWIPHWIHTGHLHIDGMKMSKSLKNFISLSELLAQDRSNSSSGDCSAGPWSCPADDFRLWCLMSGSYRGPTTYSKTDIAEARKLRGEKICKLLEEGEERLRHARNSSRNESKGNTRAACKTWNESDMDIFRFTAQRRQACLRALYDDLDGALFVKELFQLTDHAFSYIRNTRDQAVPDEVLIHVLQNVRYLLDLVGFSEVTCRTGLDSDAQNKASDASSKVVGGERGLLNEIVRFRKSVRDAALSTKGEDDIRSLKAEILRLCDEARESTFPAMGVQLHDGKHAHTSTGTADTDNSLSSFWNYCIPVSNTQDAVEDGSEPPSSRTVKTRSEMPSLQDYFRVGHYEGMFSAFSDDGFPTHDADGTELSKNQTKKLLKKRESHGKRLEASKKQ